MISKTSVLSNGHLNIILLVALIHKITAPLAGWTSNYDPGTYFQYINVPGKNEYNFGFHRGNTNHFISRYEQGKDWNFKTKVHWADKQGGLGEHYWEYNHIDKGKLPGGTDYSNEHLFGNSGKIIGNYGSPGELYGSLGGNYASVSSNHGIGGATHASLGNGLGHLGNSYTSLGDVHGTLATNYGTNHGTLGTNYGQLWNLNNGYGNLGFGYENLGGQYRNFAGDLSSAAMYKMLAEHLERQASVPTLNYRKAKDTKPDAGVSLYTNATFLSHNHRNEENDDHKIMNTTKKISIDMNTEVVDQRHSGRSTSDHGHSNNDHDEYDDDENYSDDYSDEDEDYDDEEE